MSLTLKHFLCLLCLFVSLVLVFYWVCYGRVFISTTAVPAESASFERHNEFACMCIWTTLMSVFIWNQFHSHFTLCLKWDLGALKNILSIKIPLKPRYLDFALICRLIGQCFAQTRTCWRGTFVKFAAPPVCLDLRILMSSASSVYT